MELLVAMYPVAQVRFACCHDLFSSLFKFLLCFNHHYWMKKKEFRVYQALIECFDSLVAFFGTEHNW